MMTDRDCMVAIFSAIAVLAQKLTGERMTIHMRTESGELIQISGGIASWEKVEESEN